jgi:UDP-3-O-[3-hydroxymyristoyl] glucosamine N-acyltransferase
MSRRFTLAQVAEAVGGKLDGPAELEVEGVASLAEAGARHLTFAKDAPNLARLAKSRAGAVLCRPGDEVGGRPAIRVENPRLAAALAVGLFRPTMRPRPGVHPTASIGEGARLGTGCSVGPFAVVGERATLGAGAVLGAHAVVGEDCRVGDGTRIDAHAVLYPGVVVGRRCAIHSGAVIGAAGFGVEMGPDGPVEFPQHGTVVLGDEVRVGANTTIDRATFASTRVGDRVKIDNLVQVSHNVTIGDGVVICALAGIGGGAVFEERSVMGPQGALSPDAVLGRGTILGARAALVTRQRLDAPGQVHMGVPAVPLEDWKRWCVYKSRTGRLRGPRPRAAEPGSPR